ncbi:MAG: ral secretion pathway protein [Candidatus Sumerlaeota bacterium]|nr:ral secretion pathway protein [Candidatus Sumerlaeota bacterium]
MAPKDPYANAKKEMELLIREEAAMSPEDRRSKGYIPRGESATKSGIKKKSNLFNIDETATWVSQSGLAPSPSSGEINFDQEFELPSEQEIIRSLTEKVGLPYVSLDQYKLEDPLAVKARSYIPSSLARDRRIFPLMERVEGGGKPILTIAISDPLNITIVDDLRLLLPEHEVEAVVVDEEDIVDSIDRYYGMGDESLDNIIESLNQEVDDEATMKRQGELEIDLESLANDPPVIKLVNLLLVNAIQDRASDLHIEPFSGSLRIRYRVDGVLREIPSPPKSLQVGLLSRIKVMAGMNIAENRIPQDGRIRLSISGKEVDLRVSDIPTVYGESIVMRVLDKSAMMIGVRQLGFQQEILEKLLNEARKPNGIVLVTGPTGSGKTTTLYAVLAEVFDSGLKFITTEDPVEYELPGIIQVNINPKVNLTFAACLRAILRQDPDVILVGEIRDVETAQISIQAALTGHMVFSTLHTNSAAATVTRLVDMGIEPFLLTSTLRAVVGQRLIRTICPSCKEPYIPSDLELEEFAVTREEVEEITFFHGHGCDNCNFTGYKGRLGIYELMCISEELNELILQRASTDEIHALALHQGMETMRSDGWLKICLGVTTFEEVSRQTPREDEETARAEMALARRAMERIDEARRRREAEDNADEIEEAGHEGFGVPEVVETPGADAGEYASEEEDGNASESSQLEYFGEQTTQEEDPARE